jgi:hypothetical protein
MPRRATLVATVSVLGRKARRAKASRRRLTFLQALSRAIAGQMAGQRLDAVLLPGGFLWLKRYIGDLSHKGRVQTLDGSRVGEACAEASRHLEKAFPGVSLAVGIDSAPRDKYFGGDNLIVAWRGGKITGLGRMVFPADTNTNGVHGMPLRCVADDYDSRHRVIRLQNGSRALLCACYDMFALRALTRGAPDSSRSIRYLDDDLGGHEPPSPERRAELLDDWRNFIVQNDVDVALAAIHQFEAPGRDSYWQRHGIAYASAALGGGLALGASHFWNALPAAEASTLAAFGVGRRHLKLGLHRKARHHQPIASLFIDGDGREKPAALVRLFEAG